MKHTCSALLPLHVVLAAFDPRRQRWQDAWPAPRCALLTLMAGAGPLLSGPLQRRARHPAETPPAAGVRADSAASGPGLRRGQGYLRRSGAG